MSLKSKGISYERELIHMFWKTGEWAAMRVAGSGSIKYPSADILAGNALRKLAIECKSSKSESVYIPKDEVDQLQQFASKFGAEPWIAVRFHGMLWHFVSMDNLEFTESSAVINTENIKNKGLLFNEVIGKFE
ncbi:Holliday junction resolvase [Candidatus Woesearchaeota archaeon]|nr:Holliday junction resolvase [Candidatus Woesearchaeota archaeon]